MERGRAGARRVESAPRPHVPQLCRGNLGTEGGGRSVKARRPPLENGMSRFGTTLGRFLIDESLKYPNIDPGIGPLLTQMAYASKIIAREVGRAALVGKLGLLGERNATGDSQKKLDVFGSETVLDAFSSTGLVNTMVSEELEDLIPLQGGENSN